MQSIVLREIIKNCNNMDVLYIATLIVIVWAAIKVYQYFRSESIRAKRQRKMFLLFEKLCSGEQVSWLRDDTRNGEPPA